MLTDLENAQLTELLSQLDREDIASLVKTVTNTLLTPENREGFPPFSFFHRECIFIYAHIM